MTIREFFRWLFGRCLACGSRYDSYRPWQYGYLWHCPTCKKETAWTAEQT